MRHTRGVYTQRLSCILIGCIFYGKVNTRTSGDLTLTPRSLSASLFGRVTSEASDTVQAHTENRILWPCEVRKPCKRK